MSTRTFFITTVTARRKPIFSDDARARLLIETLLHYRTEKKYEIHEFVVMPDHVHVLLTPSHEISLERAVQFIKGGFSFRLRARGTVWQESFTNHHIRDERDFERHREYIRENPVVAGLMKRKEEYPYGSWAIAGCADAPPAFRESA